MEEKKRPLRGAVLGGVGAIAGAFAGYFLRRGSAAIKPF
jgi:hypothetical protein